MMFLLLVQSVRAVDVDVVVRNQQFSNDTFFFDIYLNTTGPDNLFLGNTDLALDYNELLFTNPSLGYLYGSTEFENSSSVATAFYDTNISTRTESDGYNANKLMIIVQMPVYTNITNFQARIARIDSRELTHKVGTFYITGATTLNTNPSLAWIASGKGFYTVINHRDSATQARGIVNKNLVNPALEPSPSIQSDNIQITATGSNSLSLSWTRGNGDSAILLMRETSAVNTFPEDGLLYTANANFGDGSKLGTDVYVVYNGSGTSVTVSGLSASTSYQFALMEYSGGNGWSENYLTSNPDTVSGTTGGAYITANIKVFLQGPYNTATGLMKTDLRMGNAFGTTNLLPEAQPYSGSPWNYTGTENVDTANHPSNAVDWVLVELRSTYNGSPVTNGQAAGFLLDDGSIVDTSGQNAIRFYNVNSGYYYVVIKHRNHLPIMTRDSIALDGSSALYDFTSLGQIQAYGSDTTTYLKLPMNEIVSGTYCMWSGDVNANNEIRYNLASNDRVIILSAIGGSNVNTSITNIYAAEDVNLNRQIRYNLANNDRVIILQNIGGTNVNSRRQIQIP